MKYLFLFLDTVLAITFKKGIAFLRIAFLGGVNRALANFLVDDRSGVLVKTVFGFLLSDVWSIVFNRSLETPLGNAIFAIVASIIVCFDSFIEDFDQLYDEVDDPNEENYY